MFAGFCVGCTGGLVGDADCVAVGGTRVAVALGLGRNVLVGEGVAVGVDVGVAVTVGLGVIVTVGVGLGV